MSIKINGWYADDLLKQCSSKGDKYAIDEELQHTDQIEAFLKKLPSASLEQLDSQQGYYLTQHGQSFVLCVCQSKLILSASLLSN